jgi:nicotinamidase-related amidase
MADHEKILEIIRLKDQAPIALETERTALLVVDVQRYFVSPYYPFGQVMEKLVPGATTEYFERVNRTVVPSINRLQELFRAKALPIIYTATGTQMNGDDLPQWLRDFDALGLALLGKRIWPDVNDPSWQIDDSVAPRSGELVIPKTSSGPLNSTKLDQTLHNLGIKSLVVTGLTTDVCVTQAAREAADRGFQVIIAEDACTTLSNQMHKGALEAFSLAFGRVRRADEIVGLMSQAEDQNSVAAC